MIKIKIDKSVLARHREYIINSNILSKFKSFKTDPVVLDKVLNDTLKEEHKKFCDYIINHVEDLKEHSLEEVVKGKNIFLGDVFSLHLINEEFEKIFPGIFKFINQKTNESIKYKDMIVEYIGYEDFSSKKLIDFFELEYKLVNKYTKKYLNDTLKSLKNSSKHNYSIEEYSEIYYQIMHDIENIEEINKRNSTVDNNLIILANEIKEHLDSNSNKETYVNNIYNSLERFGANYKNGYVSLKNYKEYMNRYDSNKSQWSAYMYVFKIGIKVCPYCNRQYIAPIYSENGKVRADLDHFYSKSKYPYLSMAIHNLIPCCKFCNSSLKGDKEFTYENNINPYDEALNDYMYFNYFPKSTSSFYGSDELIIKLMEREGVDKDKVRKFKNNLKTFQIEALYQYNTNIVKAMLKKRMIFTNKYIENLYINYNNIFKSEDEIVQLLFNSTVDKDEDIPLYKLKYDMIKQIIKEDY